jgi:hypothetical protein
MPRATGRASQNLIDRIHRQTAKAIDATFRQHAKDNTLVPAAFIGQAIKFLEKTGSTEAARTPPKVDRLASLLSDYDPDEDSDETNFVRQPPEDQ